jgi:hypothetical protein
MLQPMAANCCADISGLSQLTVPDSPNAPPGAICAVES